MSLIGVAATVYVLGQYAIGEHRHGGWSYLAFSFGVDAVALLALYGLLHLAGAA